MKLKEKATLIASEKAELLGFWKGSENDICGYNDFSPVVVCRKMFHQRQSCFRFKGPL